MSQRNKLEENRAKLKELQEVIQQTEKTLRDPLSKTSFLYSVQLKNLKRLRYGEKILKKEIRHLEGEHIMDKYDPIKEELDEESKKMLEDERYRLNITQDDINIALEYTKKSVRVDNNMYNQLVNLISHPSAIVRLRLIPDSKDLQIKLNKTISFNRKIFWIGIIVGVIGLLAKLIVLIILGVLILVCWYFVLQPRQTLLSIELGARLFAIDGKEDPTKFKESYESMNKMYREKFGRDSL